MTEPAQRRVGIDRLDVCCRMPYRPDIDGLRAVAVLSVVAFHAFPGVMPGGFVGVDIFFVVSGFLISRLIFESLERHDFQPLTFYARRARRILPALITVLSATFLVGVFLLTPPQLLLLGQQMAASSAFLANVWFWAHSGYFDPAAKENPLLHLWSLGAEEQFYVIWPLIVVLSWRYRRIGAAIVGIALASFALNIGFAGYRSTVFYLLPFRVWELMLGAGILLLPRVRSRRIVEIAAIAGCVCILVAVFSYDDTVHYPGWRAVLPTAGCGLLIWSGGSHSLVGDVFRNRAAVLIGLISYPLYLWHWPLLWFLRTVDPADDTAAVRVLMCIVAVVLAFATYRYIEQPIRHAMGPPWKLAFATGAMVLVGGLASLNGFSFRVAGAVREMSAYTFDLYREYRVGTCHLLPTQGPEHFTDACSGDDGVASESAKRIVIWGDSAASGLYPGLNALKGARFSVAEYTASACPPIFGSFTDRYDRPHCPAINEFVWRIIQQQRPDVVLLAAAPIYESDNSRIVDTASRLKTLGVPTVVIAGPFPQWQEALPSLIIKAISNSAPTQSPTYLPLSAATWDRLSKLDATLKMRARASNVLYVSALNNLCSSGACRATIGGVPITWDNSHLTDIGSRAMARAFYRRLEGNVYSGDPHNATGREHW
jgi:peptidoglycan/LPS O-acetylase OafA/YrhL